MISVLYVSDYATLYYVLIHTGTCLSFYSYKTNRKVSLDYNFANVGHLMIKVDHNFDSVLVVGYEPEATHSVTAHLVF